LEAVAVAVAALDLAVLVDGYLHDSVVAVEDYLVGLAV
jgi:hypothetical protein